MEGGKSSELYYIECAYWLLFSNELSDPNGTFKKTLSTKKSGRNIIKKNGKLAAAVNTNYGLMDAKVKANFGYSHDDMTEEN
jgi:hypothetical protein